MLYWTTLTAWKRREGRGYKCFAASERSSEHSWFSPAAVQVSGSRWVWWTWAPFPLQSHICKKRSKQSTEAARGLQGEVDIHTINYSTILLIEPMQPVTWASVHPIVQFSKGTVHKDLSPLDLHVTCLRPSRISRPNNIWFSNSSRITNDVT